LNPRLRGRPARAAGADRGALDLAIGRAGACDDRQGRARDARRGARRRALCGGARRAQRWPETIADLKGKKISVSNRGALTYWLAQELSRRQGWGRKASPSRRSAATTAQAAALKTKQIDGMIVEVNAGYRLEEEKSGRVLVQLATP